MKRCEISKLVVSLYQIILNEVNSEKRKILEYLLKPLERVDKSKFLNKIGYNH